MDSRIAATPPAAPNWVRVTVSVIESQSSPLPDRSPDTEAVEMDELLLFESLDDIEVIPSSLCDQPKTNNNGESFKVKNRSKKWGTQGRD